MAKKSGKTAVAEPEVQAAAPVEAAPAAAEETKKKNGVFINNHLNTLIKDVSLEKSGEWKSVRMYLGEPGTPEGSVKSSILVRPGQVKDSTDKNGNAIEGRSNILLGDRDRTYQVQTPQIDASGNMVKGADGKTVYTKTEMTVDEIMKKYEANKSAYKEGKKAEEKAAQAQAAAPSAEAASDEPSYA